jgi:hypothetical protein
MLSPRDELVVAVQNPALYFLPHSNQGCPVGHEVRIAAIVNRKWAQVTPARNLW